jgi:hypothetical protein
MELIVAVILIAGLVYGLERNRRHQAQPRSRLAGSSDIVDRDNERIFGDLRART